MRTFTMKIGLIATCMLALSSCATEPRYTQSDRGDYRSYRETRCEYCGTVSAIDPVWVDDNRVGGGTLLGVIIGGALGNQIGSGDGRRAATAAGAIAGGVIGHEVEKDRRDQRRGFRIEVRLDDGRYAHVVQLDDSRLRIGDRVTIRDDRVYAIR
jgi:outer membrane lipoprotein SlyB